MSFTVKESNSHYSQIQNIGKIRISGNNTEISSKDKLIKITNDQCSIKKNNENNMEKTGYD